MPQSFNHLQLTLCHSNTPKDDKVTILYTPWTAPSVTVARIFICVSLHSSEHAHSEAVRNFKQFKTSVGCARYWTFHYDVIILHTSLGL